MRAKYPANLRLLEVIILIMRCQDALQFASNYLIPFRLNALFSWAPVAQSVQQLVTG
jgi:hypothetical protein